MKNRKEYQPKTGQEDTPEHRSTENGCEEGCEACSQAEQKATHTPTPKVTFDGCGINDTDEYASRLATFTERGRPFGEAIVRAVNSHEELLRVCKMIYDAEHVQDKFAEPWMIELGEAIAKAEGK